MYTLFDNTRAWSNVYVSRHTHKHKKKNKNHTLTFALSLSSNNLISLSDRATDGLLTHVPFNFDICQASTISLVVLS